jgi:H+/Cl- antiporter ClcA
MQGPLSGVVIVLELTGHFDTLMAPTLLAGTRSPATKKRRPGPSSVSPTHDRRL